jgi:glutamyl-Q tRNA(Asp) synthetase
LLAEGRPYAWRLSMDAARAALGPSFETLTFHEEGRGPGGESGVVPARAETAGDIVLARKDVGVAYHLAVVVDDALQAVTHVIRERTCSRRPGCSVCCRRCWACPSPSTAITA